jgi:hypothetical protein
MTTGDVPLEGAAAWTYAVSFLPDGMRVLSAAADGALSAWDLMTWTKVSSFPRLTGRNILFADFSEADLANGEDPSLNMAISSVVVVSGTWAFYQNANYDAALGSQFGPGAYAMVSGYGVANDAIRSLKCIG